MMEFVRRQALEPLRRTTVSVPPIRMDEQQIQPSENAAVRSGENLSLKFILFRRSHHINCKKYQVCVQEARSRPLLVVTADVDNETEPFLEFIDPGKFCIDDAGRRIAF